MEKVVVTLIAVISRSGSGRETHIKTKTQKRKAYNNVPIIVVKRC
jgi:hypothetical protein